MNITTKEPKNTQPCLVLASMVPKVTVSAEGIKSMDRMCSTLLKGVGFSNGCAAFTLKKPPPLVPMCLMLSKLATGPRMSCWRAPSTVVATASLLKVCGMPCHT